MVNVIGLGYIGLPTALILSAHGIKVVGTDYNASLVERLKKGIATFKEDGLDDLFAKAIDEGVEFSTMYQSTDTYIISVPTPYDKLSKKVDASYVVAAVEEVLKVCHDEADIIIESTISPNTIDRDIRPLVTASGRNVNLAHAPERIIPGNMIHELRHNNRTIGADSSEVAERVRQLYKSFCRGEIVCTDIRTAEMTKVVENTFRAVNIAFANELLRICHYNNMDVNEVISICNKHPRVNIINPGPGVGGHCIPIDPWFLVGEYPQLTHMITASLNVNASQPEYVLQRIYEIMKENDITSPHRVGLYGLTYKENVDDYRESPSLQLLELQKRHLAEPMLCYDPYLEGRHIVDTQTDSFDAFLNNVDMVVVMVKHNHIRQNWHLLENKVILDCHNICPLDNSYKL